MQSCARRAHPPERRRAALRRASFLPSPRRPPDLHPGGESRERAVRASSHSGSRVSSRRLFAAPWSGAHSGGSPAVASPRFSDSRSCCVPCWVSLSTLVDERDDRGLGLRYFGECLPQYYVPVARG